MNNQTSNKSKLNKKLIGMVCNILEEGNYIETACRSVGISSTTYHAWMRRATEEEHDRPDVYTLHREFKDRVEQARAKAEVKLIEEIKKGDRGWQAKAWVLERTRQDRFGQKQQIEQTVTVNPPLVPPNPPKTHDAWLKRRLQRTQQNSQLQEKAVDAEIVEDRISNRLETRKRMFGDE